MNIINGLNKLYKTVMKRLLIVAGFCPHDGNVSTIQKGISFCLDCWKYIRV